MSLVRQHRMMMSALLASAPAMEGGLAPAISEGAQPDQQPGYDRAVDVAARQIALRLNHDLRRLKEIKSVANKVGAKREMIGEYAGWIAGILAAGGDDDGTALAPSVADEVLPTVMVWAIDTGDWAYALRLAAHVLRHDVKLPARYQRDAPTLVLEEIAEVALKAQAQGQAFPLDVLEQVEALVAGIDMHDEPRAKLLKAIGTELARAAEGAEGLDARRLTLDAIAQLGAAQALHDRVGVKTQLRGLEKALAALPAPEPATGTDTPTDPAGDAPADTDQAGTTPVA